MYLNVNSICWGEVRDCFLQRACGEQGDSRRGEPRGIGIAMDRSFLCYKMGTEGDSRQSYPSILPLYGQISTALIELSTDGKGEIMVLEREEQARGKRDG